MGFLTASFRMFFIMLKNNVWQTQEGSYCISWEKRQHDTQALVFSSPLLFFRLFFLSLLTNARYKLVHIYKSKEYMYLSLHIYIYIHIYPLEDQVFTFNT